MAHSGLSIGTATGGGEYTVTLATCCREALLLADAQTRAAAEQPVSIQIPAEFTAGRANTTLTEPTSATKTGR